MRGLLLALLIALWPSALQAQAFPPEAQRVVTALYARWPQLAHSDSDDDRRTLTRMMAEQLHHDLGPTWGTKASSPTNPPSKDAIAQRQTGVDGQGRPILWAWDWQDGTTRAPQVPPIFHVISGQHFLPVTPIDHLGSGSPAAPPAPSAPEPPPLRVSDLDALLELLAEHDAESRAGIDTLRLQLAVHTQKLESLAADHSRQPTDPERDPTVPLDEKGFTRRWLVERILPMVLTAIGGWVAAR